MRRLALLTLFALIALPAQAANPEAGDIIFGKTECDPSFKCPPSFDSETLRVIAPQILARANSCVSSRFGMRNPAGYFEEGMGLDYNLCLTSKDQPKAEKGLTMTPKCCIMQSTGNSDLCRIVCTKYGVR